MKKQFLLGLMAMLLPLSAWAQHLSVTLSSESAPYSGTDQLETVKSGLTVNFYGVEEPLVLDRDYTVTFDKDEVKNAGTYIVTVAGKEGTSYAVQTPVTKTFTITKIALNLTKENLDLKKETKPYGVTTFDVSEYVTLDSSHGVVTGDGEEADALLCLSLVSEYKTDEDDGVGSEEMLCLKANDESTSKNYTFAGKVYFNVTVEKNVLTATLSEENRTRVYNAQGTTLEELKNKIEGIELVKDELTLTVEGEKTIKDADTYTINLTLSEEAQKNYGITETLTYTITRAPIYVKLNEGVELTKVYNGEQMTVEDTKNYFTVNGIFDADKDDVEVTVEPSNGTKANVNAGEKISLSPYVNGKQVQSKDFGAPTNLTNYYIDYNNNTTKLVQITITPRPVKYYFAGGSKTYDAVAKTVLDTKDYTVKYIEEDGTGFIENDDVEVSTAPTATFKLEKDAEDIEVKNAGDYPLTVAEDGEGELTGEAANNYELVFDEDYTLPEGAEAANVNKYVIDKAKFEARVVDYEVHYTTDEEVVDELKAALENYLKITTSTITYEGQSTTGKNIVRSSVTSQLLNGGVNDIVKALVASQTLKVDAEEIDFTKVGEYDIEFSITADEIDADNFDITLTAGKLKITGDASITLNGDDAETEVTDLLKVYDGATVTVNIKGLRNFTNMMTGTKFEENGFIKANQWYTLVLPFEVTVRELSNAFGYAVVNVPNTTASEDGAAHFKLTLGTVEANTLMAFKVDQDIEWNEDTVVVFKDKKIVSVADDYEWATDGTNKFIGVYEKKTIDKETEKFLLPTTGQFYKASVVAANNGTGYELYPLNGYVETGSANARIIMEEADGSTTAIDAITGEVINENAGGWYTVGGVKLNAQPTQKGIYINNGKKVVIK